ncbi:MAG: nucleotide-diphospho-sugar transferase [Lentisphaeria bacterium]|nr:nucleotide-diphospho-sugar transferase [Lentisphaeria bacterium]
MKKPVLFLIFNRPDTTFRVFEAIRQYQPAELFIAADGPRPERAGEKALCDEVRRVASMVDWECEVHTLFREKNLGCKYAIVEAIDWFFDSVEEGIILEDDCLPCPDFFRFCEEMLVRYRDDEKVMHIGGSNFNYGRFFTENADYCFSIYTFVWGWATWRRAWKHFEAEMESFPDYCRKNRICEIFPGAAFKQWRFLRIFRKCYEKKPYFSDVWDYLWTFTLFRKNASGLVPRRNLVTNIGLEGGTHTMHKNQCNTILEELPRQLQAPEKVQPDTALDNRIFRNIYKGDWKDLVRYLLSRITGKDWM